jgi:hypothetical protein
MADVHEVFIPIFLASPGQGQVPISEKRLFIWRARTMPPDWEESSLISWIFSVIPARNPE